MGVASSSFPYKLGEEITSDAARNLSNWRLHNAVCKETKDDVSVFAFDKKCSSRQHVAAAQSLLMRLKTTRHPHILRFIASTEVPDSLYIVTERVKPLLIRANGAQLSPQAIALGLYELSSAVSFLNNDCNLAHCCISSATVFVTRSGDWRLGGLDIVTDASNLRSYSSSSFHSLPSSYLPPEVVKGKTLGSPLHSIDSWTIACLIFEVFNGPLSNPKLLTQTANIPKELLTEYRGLLATVPSQRISAQKLLSSGYFQSPFVQSIDFLDNIALKSQREKDEFFRQLSTQLDTFPEECAKFKVLPCLTNALEFGSASPRVLSAMLSIGAKLESDDFNRLVVPTIQKLFSSSDRSIRLSLLQHLPQYHQHLSKKLIDGTLFANILTGFTDTEPSIKEASVKSLLFIVPKLSEKTIQTTVMAVIGRMQRDPMPSIRTNTVIVVGKVAASLPPRLQQRLLLASYTRALRDPFVPSRKSALAALQVTAGLFAVNQIARTLLPLAGNHVLDPARDVREQALKTLRSLTDVLEKHAAEMPDSSTAPVPTATTTSAPDAPRQGGAAHSSQAAAVAQVAVAAVGSKAVVAAAAASGLLGSMSGWAVSSFKNKVYGADGSEQKSAMEAPAASYSAPVPPPPSSLEPAAATSLAPPARAEPRGWDHDDDDENFFSDYAIDDDDPLAAPDLISKLSVSRTPAVDAANSQTADPFDLLFEDFSPASSSTAPAAGPLRPSANIPQKAAVPKKPVIAPRQTANDGFNDDFFKNW